MEKNIFLYAFSVKLYNGTKEFYFDNKSNAEFARRVVFKAFDKQRISQNGFIPPVSKLERKIVDETNLNNYQILTSYGDFENYWFKITEQMCENCL